MKRSELESLVKMVRFVVREELKKELPRMVESVLAEQFIKKVVAERSGASKRRATNGPSLSEALGDELTPEDEENQIPEPLRNVHKGIYHKSPLMHNDEDEEPLQAEFRSPLADKSANPSMAYLYENLRPISEDEGRSAIPEVPLSAIQGMNPETMRAMAGIERTEERGPIPLPPDAKMREIERRRKMLDEQVVNGGRSGGTPRPRPQMSMYEPEGRDDRLAAAGQFPDKPIVFED
jgi:hypothetical protein